jgi:surfeit locus 1 family protein
MTSEHMPAAAARTRWRSPMLAAILGILGLAILLGLGTWQVQRLHWKEGLLATIHTRINAQPETLAAVEKRFRDTGDVEYWPVTVQGHFLNDRERHFLATWQGASGFDVYTPLVLDDGRIIFVNRGFVPYDRKDPSTRKAGEVEGEVSISGLARNPLSKKPSWFVPDDNVAENVFFWKDLKTMVASAGLSPARVLPFFVDAGSAPNPGGLPVGGVTIIDLPNNHLQYALTWYGLAATLAGVLVINVLPLLGIGKKV